MRKPNFYEILVEGAHLYYFSPMNLLEEPYMSWDEKKDLLLNWKYYLMCESDSNDSQTAFTLMEIHKALKFLQNRRNLH